MNKVFYI